MDISDCHGDTMMGLRSFAHPRYFYGQRLDVRHFQDEQDYFKEKSRLHNRLLHGWGVVCGLDVTLGPDGKSVVVEPGFALDKLGREIIVPVASRPIPIPTRPAQPDVKQEHCDDDDDWVRVVICFHACETDPEPVLSGECDSPRRCASGSIRERYEIPEPRPGKKHHVNVDCEVQDLIKGNRINYAALANWVSRSCGDVPRDPCITLANVKRPVEGSEIDSADIDITVRPIAYSMEVLWQVALCLVNDQYQRRAGRH